MPSAMSRARERTLPGAPTDRLPPGQSVTDRFPVLHYGSVPAIDLTRWDLNVFGLVEEPRRFRYEEILALPRRRIVADIHCVTGWSKLDTVWEGARFRDAIASIRLRPEARFVLVHAEAGFTTNLPIDVLMDDDVLLAYRYADADLSPEHGWPLRLVVPRKYFWKSAKWIRGFEFLAEDQLGFWERHGYNSHADPWKEERYA